MLSIQLGFAVQYDSQLEMAELGAGVTEIFSNVEIEFAPDDTYTLILTV